MKTPIRNAKLRTDEAPRLEHRVEAWIRASHFAIKGVNCLLHAMMLQQTPRWSKQRKRMQRAVESFENAQRWTQISQNLVVRRGKDK